MERDEDDALVAQAFAFVEPAAHVKPIKIHLHPQLRYPETPALFKTETTFHEVLQHGCGRVTRRVLKMTGTRFEEHLTLVCFKCQAGKDFGKESALRKHYKTEHRLDFGVGPLPKGPLYLGVVGMPTHKRSCCPICWKKQWGEASGCLHEGQWADEHLMLEHVPAEFKRLRCTACGKEFLLGEQLEGHLQQCYPGPYKRCKLV
ncbi:unnamed protein product [Sphagnum tenellum]